MGYIKTEQLIPELKVVNTETGELVSGVAKISTSRLPDFIMCFLSTLNEAVDLDGNTMRVMMICWIYSSFNPTVCEANVVCNGRPFKDYAKQMCPRLTDAVINRAFVLLKRRGLLIRRGRGEYILNPRYFFKGTLTNRSKLIAHLTLNGDNNPPTSAADQ